LSSDLLVCGAVPTTDGPAMAVVVVTAAGSVATAVEFATAVLATGAIDEFDVVDGVDGVDGVDDSEGAVDSLVCSAIVMVDWFGVPSRARAFTRPAVPPAASTPTIARSVAVRVRMNRA